MFDLSTVQFAKTLGVGWNLGNTLDATGNSGLETEISWGVPYTTNELIAFIKSSGFDTIRLPVTWHRHIDADCVIDSAWMERIKTIVDWSLECGLKVILNIHHDNQMHYPSADKKSDGLKYIKAIWSQIAECFREYDENLIFESMNEPRLSGTDIEWYFVSGNEKGEEAIRIICEYNQMFVDTVRSSGGNNVNRYLMVPSYAAAFGFTKFDDFKMPADTSNHTMLSVHAYTPYEFAMKEDGYSVWDGSHKNELGFIKELYELYVKNGIGVVIGEYGCINRNNDSDRVNWAKDYVSIAAECGIPCVWWDNAQRYGKNETYEIINRSSLSLSYPEIVKAIVSNKVK